MIKCSVKGCLNTKEGNPSSGFDCNSDGWSVIQDQTLPTWNPICPFHLKQINDLAEQIYAILPVKWTPLVILRSRDKRDETK